MDEIIFPSSHLSSTILHFFHSISFRHFSNVKLVTIYIYILFAYVYMSHVSSIISFAPWFPIILRLSSLHKNASHPVVSQRLGLLFSLVQLSRNQDQQRPAVAGMCWEDLGWNGEGLMWINVGETMS